MTALTTLDTPTPTDPAPAHEKQAEQERVCTPAERLRQIDCEVERAPGRSVTEIYPHAKIDQGRGEVTEWFWTSQDSRGVRRPKVVSRYSTSDLETMILYHEGTERFGRAFVEVDPVGGQWAAWAWFGSADDVEIRGTNHAQVFREAICRAYIQAAQSKAEAKERGE